MVEWRESTATATIAKYFSSLFDSSINYPFCIIQSNLHLDQQYFSPSARMGLDSPARVVMDTREAAVAEIIDHGFFLEKIRTQI